jgi:hypothetical protein
LTLDDIRMILNATAVDLSVSTLSQGAGLIDVEEAIDLGETWREQENEFSCRAGE